MAEVCETVGTNPTNAINRSNFSHPTIPRPQGYLISAEVSGNAKSRDYLISERISGNSGKGQILIWVLLLTVTNRDRPLLIACVTCMHSFRYTEFRHWQPAVTWRVEGGL